MRAHSRRDANHHPSSTLVTIVVVTEGCSRFRQPLQPVRVQGIYRAGAGTFLRVQRWEGGSGCPFPRRLTKRGSSPLMSNLVSQVVTAFVSWSRIRCDVQNLCTSDRMLTASGHQPRGPRSASSLAKTTTLSRYLCLAES